MGNSPVCSETGFTLGQRAIKSDAPSREASASFPITQILQLFKHLVMRPSRLLIFGVGPMAWFVGWGCGNF